MKMKLPPNMVRRIDGQRIGLSWLDKIESVYSDEAMYMNWHTHDAIEVICCLKGIMSYEFYGKQDVTLKMSELLVIPPRCRHRLSNGVDAPSRRVSFLVNKAPSLQSESKLGVFTRNDLADIRKGLLNRRFQQTAFSAHVRESLLRLRYFLHQGQHLSRQDLCEIRVLASAIILDASRDAVQMKPKGEERMFDEAIAWIERNYAHEVSISALVEYMGYGRSRFFELFKRKTGLSPNEYIIRYRISKAQEILSSGTASVADTAAQVGFADPAFFSRTFRRLLGFPPSSLTSGRTQ